MGESGDEKKRPAKRIRLDPPDDARRGPAPASHPQHVNGGFFHPLANGNMTSWIPPPSFHSPWNLSHVSAGPESLSMHLPDSIATIVPDPTILLSHPVENTAACWPSNFDGVPNNAHMAAAFPTQLRHIVDPTESIPPQHPFPPPIQPQQQQSLQPLSCLYPQTQVHAQTDSERPRPPPTLNTSTPKVPNTEKRRRKPRSRHAFTSPFTDCIDTFGNKFTLQQFSRPSDGKVNGYIKFSWPRKANNVQRITDITNVSNQPRTTDKTDVNSEHDSILATVPEHYTHLAPRSDNTAMRQGLAFPSTSSILSTISADGSCYSTPSAVVLPTNAFLPQSSGHALVSLFGNPRCVPPHFGYEAKMDAMDRKLWKFYLMNWCPGRSVLKGTNLWLTDFPRMHDSPGILSAIQSLAGVYIHDYLPNEAVRRRVNERFAIAEARLRRLLQDSATLNSREQSELVTLSSILSMQDIVLTERRLKKPSNPRWLQGFKQGEQVLQATDPGNRFYKPCNVQIDALRASQAIIVSRAVILAQPMMPLTPVAHFDPVYEASRFGFLLYGSERDLFEIHGGCGFSKRLLHIFSQVSFCATRMLQDPETTVVPHAANMLYRHIFNLHQWSEEFCSWEEAQSRPPPIEWIRQTSEDFVVNNAADMTDVTAEAWRLAGMVYLQCRLFRLPRNHPNVMVNLSDLAKSISIMPTSGSVFTAQAPLLPVFLLGLLATVEDHIEVADAWFQQVIRTPVRSSVPPLYESLGRIQAWMASEVPLHAPNMKLPPTISERQPWWERMVYKVHEKEREVLCLT